MVNKEHPGTRGAARRTPAHHRAPADNSLRYALHEWYHQEFDYEWIVRHRSTRGLHRSIQNVAGAATVLFAVSSVLMVFSSYGPQGHASLAWIGIVLLLQVLVSCRWFFGPLPTRRDFVAFAIFGDVGLTSVLSLYDPFGALIGAGLFVVTGALCTYFLSQRWLLAHLLWCGTFVAATMYRASISGREDIATVLAGGLMILVINCAVPVLAHIAWTAIGRDARRSLLDPLTGLLNRRGVDDESVLLVTASLQQRHTLAIVVLDIDKFKVINDQYGHDCGDAVLVSIANRLTMLFGDQGVVARTGGEEFLVAFSSQAQHVHILIGRVAPFLYCRDDEIPITVSVGAAIVMNQSAIWGDRPTLITQASRAADTMMYKAKREGGNRTAITIM